MAMLSRLQASSTAGCNGSPIKPRGAVRLQLGGASTKASGTGVDPVYAFLRAD
jgi:hypothetical protein